MQEEKTPENVFRVTYALSPNKLFQEAVWGLVQSGMTVKEAERIVGEQVMVKESRHRVPVGQPQSKLSFAEGCTKENTKQQNRQGHSSGYVAKVAKKAKQGEQRKEVGRVKKVSSESVPPGGLMEASSKVGKNKRPESKEEQETPPPFQPPAAKKKKSTNCVNKRSTPPLHSGDRGHSPTNQKGKEA